MDPREAELLARLLPTFRQEAEEHLRQLEGQLAGLSREPTSRIMEEAFREVHSLKGAARAVGAGELEGLCQEMEAVFAALGKGEISPEQDLVDLLLLATDLAADLARTAGEGIPTELQPLVAVARQRLMQAAAGEQMDRSPLPRPEPETPAQPPPLPPSDTLRIGAEKIGQVLVQAEELLAEKLTARGQAAALRELLGRLGDLRRTVLLATAERRTLQRRNHPQGAGARRGADGEHRLWGVLQEAAQAARELETTAREVLRRGEEHARFLGLKVDSLVDAIRATLMLPVSTLLEPLPRMVRDLAREGGKGVELETAGGEIEIDRRLLEELRTPLLHLLRNAIDHGLEAPDERLAAGKPPRGHLRVAASAPSPRRVLFTLSDDGRGLDLPRLRAAAVRTGLLEAGAAAELDDLQAAELAFTSGLTTLEDPSAVSGRGLGLPIVREKVERLGGEVRIASRPGEGTSFSLEIPATLAAFRGILTRLGPWRYIFPSEGVERVLRIAPLGLQATGHRPLLELAGSEVPVVRLEEPLRLPLTLHRGEEILPLVVVNSPRGRIAFAVDEILGEQEFLVKDLGEALVNVKNFSGSAILGDGGIALIIEPQELIASAGAPGTAPLAPPVREPVQERRRVLVVEDSITSRTLLRNILEGAGYAVVTAVDGLDALERLAATEIDIVVSDVEMPRLDGFRLTARIRENYGRLPVILVTGREDAEDRRRGLEAGADAYLVKSRFDQGNLLEVIGRLT